MDHFKKLVRLRQRRAFRVRKRIRGTPDRPRLSVIRSHKHISAQIIDDLAGKTLAAASSQDKKLVRQAQVGRQSRCGASRRQGDCRTGNRGRH